MTTQALQDKRAFVVLMADDDPEDVSLVREALAESAFQCDFRTVSDGYELLLYLHRRGFYADSARSPDPSLILLDLNMPLRNGTEVLAEIKSTPHLCSIPVVILTTSDADRDRVRTANLGADGYLTKPSSYSALVELTRALYPYLKDTGGHHAT
jgi:CheY-like chemotaxis protein